MAATTTSQLVRSDAVRSMTSDETSLEQEILARLTDIGPWNSEVFATIERTFDIDIQRAREESLTDGSFEDVGEPDHADSEVTNTVSNATSNFHPDRGRAPNMNWTVETIVTLPDQH